MKANLFATVLAFGLMSAPAQASTYVSKTVTATFEFTVFGEMTGPATAVFGLGFTTPIMHADPDYPLRFLIDGGYPQGADITADFTGGLSPLSISFWLVPTRPGCIGDCMFHSVEVDDLHRVISLAATAVVTTFAEYQDHQYFFHPMILGFSHVSDQGLQIVRTPGPLAGAGILPLLGLGLWVVRRRRQVK